MIEPLTGQYILTVINSGSGAVTLDPPGWIYNAGTQVQLSDWTELFHDPIIVTAVLDRLLHHSVVINIKGNSYRLKGKMKEKELNELQKVN